MKWGEIPVTGAKIDPTGGYSTVSLSLDDLLAAANPSENIFVRPGDVITIPKAEIVYVLGDVKKAGGFPLSSHPTISILQALALAEGLAPDSSANHARIVRPAPGGDGLPKRSRSISRASSPAENPTSRSSPTTSSMFPTAPSRPAPSALPRPFSRSRRASSSIAASTHRKHSLSSTSVSPKGTLA